MLLLADRYYCGFPLWSQAAASGAELWRVKSNICFRVLGRFPDGPWPSVLTRIGKDGRSGRGECSVRVFNYRFAGIKGRFSVATSLLDPFEARAAELAALHHERWEFETAYGEAKAHMLGSGAVLRSKTPGLVQQELHGLPTEDRGRSTSQSVCTRIGRSDESRCRERQANSSKLTIRRTWPGGKPRWRGGVLGWPVSETAQRERASSRLVAQLVPHSITTWRDPAALPPVPVPRSRLQARSRRFACRRDVARPRCDPPLPCGRRRESREPVARNARGPCN